MWKGKKINRRFNRNEEASESKNNGQYFHLVYGYECNYRTCERSAFYLDSSYFAIVAVYELGGFFSCISFFLAEFTI